MGRAAHRRTRDCIGGKGTTTFPDVPAQKPVSLPTALPAVAEFVHCVYILPLTFPFDLDGRMHLHPPRPAPARLDCFDGLSLRLGSRIGIDVSSWDSVRF